MTDPFVPTLMTQMVSCLTSALSTHPNPPQNIERRVGLEIAHDADLNVDLCCEGLAYVTLGDQWPSSDSFPETDINRQTRASCAPVTWGVSFKLGIIRCAPVGTDTSRPTAAEWAAASDNNINDAYALRLATCCFRTWVLASQQFFGMSVAIGRQSQGTPQGGCVERNVTVDVQIPNCEC